MKRRKIKTKFLVIIFFLLFVLMAVLGIINDERRLSFFERIGKDIVTTINKVIYYPIGYIKKISNCDYSNDFLQDEEITKLNSEIKELKELLELNDNINAVYKNANVINRNVGYWYSSLTIDIGTKDGIKDGDTVITAKGLIGYIIKSSYTSSTVKLITDDVIKKISVKINSNGNYIYGILTGYDKNQKNFIVEGLSHNLEIANGDIVTTTGYAGYYSDIYVGKVIEVTPDKYDLTKVVRLQSDVDFDNINFVTVITGVES